jgi:hypothetical protein
VAPQGITDISVQSSASLQHLPVDRSRSNLISIF